MNLSNVIATMITEMLESEGVAQFQRNILAQNLGCAPSQINYVISSRFTPERGFIVESRRGGGGCVKITRIDYDEASLLLKIVGSVGNELDEKESKEHLFNLLYRRLISQHDASMIASATADSVLKCVPEEYRDVLRAAIFKQMLLTAIQN